MSSHFTKIAENLDVEPLLCDLDDNPQLWDQRKERTAGNSPHREASDIWIRYASEEAMRQPGFMTAPHRSIWWPAAAHLPALMDLTMEVMDALEGDLKLGGILITRIPGGKQVYEHTDRGTWHSEHYDQKVWVVLRGNDRCINTVEDEEMVWKPGEGWMHDNLLPHSVRNEGESERIVLILCFRRR
jgi:mannose-6-phosphate isomerase-like protein (cupin superfamily)